MIENINFPVIKKKLVTEEGVYSGKMGVLRTDTNQILGVVGEDYQLLQHTIAVKATESVLESVGKYEIIQKDVTHAGARIYYSYNFPDIKYNITDDDDICLTLVMQNSYDGLLKFGFLLGAFRFICTNGMRIGTTLFEISHKHTQNLSLDGIAVAATKSITHFQDVIIPSMRSLTQKRIDSLVTLNYKLDTIRDQGFLPKKLIDVVEEHARHSRIKTEWDLYNEFTRYLTHDYDKSRERAGTLLTLTSKAFGL